VQDSGTIRPSLAKSYLSSMPVHRAIFRLDFPLNYGVIDAPGKLLELLNTAVPEGFWESMQDSVKDRAIGTKFSDAESPSVYRSILISPTFIIFNIEEVAGFGSLELTEKPTTKILIELASTICDRYKIQDINRAGLRLWTFDEVTPATGTILSMISRQINSKLTEMISAKVGAIADVGLAFNGAIDAHAKYHVRFGPCLQAELESNKYIEKINKKFIESTKVNLVFDIDMYEEAFSLKGRRVAAWIKHQAMTANILEKNITNLLKSDDEPAYE
jgi:hypothetical protein